MFVTPIETHYKGFRFRSRLEARYAVFFDSLGLQWTYEPQGYELPSGRYLPDFLVKIKMPNGHIVESFFEIKPRPEPTEKKIYLAGKMTDWRSQLATHGHYITGPDEESKPHNRELHGQAMDSDHPRQVVVAGCFSSIMLSNVVFAWIDALNAFATLTELGIAKANCIEIYCAVDSRLWNALDSASGQFSDPSNHGQPTGYHDLWFVETMSSGFGFYDTAQEGFDAFFPLTDEERKCRDLSNSGTSVYLCHGDPVEALVTLFAHGVCVWRDKAIGSASFGPNLQDQVISSALAARRARFEHGECGAPK